MTMKKPSGETTTIRTLSIVTVSPTKRIMDIYNEIKIILRLLFVRKVSQKTKRKLNGETVMMNPAKVKVNPIKTYA